MSDRICVMRTGSIEQIGTPRDLYYRPRSRFVAAFFGASNILEPCRVERIRDDITTVSTPCGTMEVRGSPPGVREGLALAVRPEAFIPVAGDHPNRIECEVASVSFVGSETITELKHPRAPQAPHHEGPQRPGRPAAGRSVPACRLASSPPSAPWSPERSGDLPGAPVAGASATFALWGVCFLFHSWSRWRAFPPYGFLPAWTTTSCTGRRSTIS